MWATRSSKLTMAEQNKNDMRSIEPPRGEEREESKGEGMTLRSRIVPAPAPTQPDFLSPTVPMNEPENVHTPIYASAGTPLLTRTDLGSPRTPTPGQEPNAGSGHEGRDVAPSPPGPPGARRIPADEGESGQEATAGTAVAGPLTGGGLNLEAAAAAETSMVAVPPTGGGYHHGSMEEGGTKPIFFSIPIAERPPPSRWSRCSPPAAGTTTRQRRRQRHFPPLHPTTDAPRPPASPKLRSTCSFYCSQRRFTHFLQQGLWSLS